MTTPSATASPWVGSDTDAATVTGNAAGGSPTGSVSFYECGPTATAQPCTSQADAVGSAVGLSAGADDTATAPSPTFTPSAAGYWCFAGYYSGDSNYGASSDATIDECFDVLPMITSGSTTSFSEGVAGSFQVTGTGGTQPDDLHRDGTLPSGVTLSSSGCSRARRASRPDLPAHHHGHLERGHHQSGFTLSVAPSNALHVTTTSLPAATIGVTYSATLTAAGGKTPYKWTVTSGTLPKGLKLTKNGMIKGNPPASAVTETFTVKVKDKTHPTQSATATLTITVS